MKPAPRACWFAPGRVNLIGDHTDHQRGLVLPFAIAAGTTVTVDINDTSRLNITSSLYQREATMTIASLTPHANSWSTYVEGVVFTLGRLGIDIPGARVTIDSDLPAGVGLASSASVTCATLAALLDATGREPEPALVARLAQEVENVYVGAPVGYMDPAAVMYGRVGHALLIDTRSRNVSAIELATAEQRLALVVVDSGHQHATSGFEYRERVRQCEAAADLLGVDCLADVQDPVDLDDIADPLVRKRARHVVTENVRVRAVSELLRSGRIREVGGQLTESHRSLRDDFGVSTPALDVIVESALRAGAFGARVTGAGFGGNALLLVDSEDAAHVTTEVTNDFKRRFGVTPAYREVTAAAGAARRPL